MSQASVSTRAILALLQQEGAVTFERVCSEAGPTVSEQYVREQLLRLYHRGHVSLTPEPPEWPPKTQRIETVDITRDGRESLRIMMEAEAPPK